MTLQEYHRILCEAAYGLQGERRAIVRLIGRIADKIQERTA